MPSRAALLASTALSGCLLATAAGAQTLPANALPSGPRVTAGAASMAQSGNRLTISQSSPRAAIAWQSYNIGSAARVHYEQPDARSIALNRVVGNDASRIYGSLTANGQVWLINPNGILFGRGARVDVGGLVASTAKLRMSDEEFVAGGASTVAFDRPGRPDAAVVNEGEITVRDAGLAALVGPAVRNAGTINARLGRVALASANGFTLDLYGDQLVNLAVDDGVLGNAIDPEGRTVRAGVENSGRIMADGGRIALSANVARGVVDNVIRMSGTLEARSVSVSQNGDIVLAGGEGGVEIAGRIDASGRGAGQRGGRVRVLGARIRVAPTVTIDASADAGGGIILIGGSYRGSGAEPRAAVTIVEAGARIRADALNRGNGGTVVVWADDTAWFDGAISARGGAHGGDGGLIETSGRLNLGVGDQALVDAGAPSGIGGTWLLDPNNVTICASSATCASPLGSLPATIGSSADANSYNVTPAAVIKALRAGTGVVTIQASNTITVASAISITTSNTPAAAALNLNAATVVINAAISSSNANRDFALTINGANGTSPASTATINAAINTVARNVTINATTINLNSTITTSGTISGTATTVNAGKSAAFATARSLTAATGTIVIDAGQGAAVIGSTLDSLGRNLTIRTAGNGHPITINAAISTGGGALTLTAGGNSNITVANNLNTAGGTVTLNAGGAIAHSGGTITGGMVNLSAGGSITQSGAGAIAASTLALATANGSATLNLANQIASLGRVAVGGAGSDLLLNDTAGGLTISGLVSVADQATIKTAGGAMTLAAGASIATTGAGGSITLVSSGTFDNQAGAGALSPGSGGRYLIYLLDPANLTSNGGLSAPCFYNLSYPSVPAASFGSRFVFASQPTLTVTASSFAATYGDATPNLADAFTISGLRAGDSLSDAVAGSPALSTAYVAGSGVAGSPYVVMAAQGTLTSPIGYRFQFVNGAVSVAPATLMVVANAQSREYGLVNPALSYQASGFRNADTATSVLAGTLVTTATQASNVGSYPITQGSLAANPNYAISFLGSTLAVTPAMLAVSANPQSREYGLADPALTYQASGLRNNDTAGAVLAGALATSATPASNVGSYPITQGTFAADPNYAIAFAGSTLAIAPAPLTVTANDAARLQGQANPPFSARFDGFRLGDTPAALVGTLVLSTPAVPSSQPGVYPIMPSGVTSRNYAVAFAPGALTVVSAGPAPPGPAETETVTVYELNQAERLPPTTPVIFTASPPIAGVGLTGLSAFLDSLAAPLSSIVIVTPEPSGVMPEALR